uniref:Peptidase S1 domain-containing protein n=1 Tax=Anopheles dirus TaxID=7168 RepID=A0A182NV06_9DIPT
MSSNRLCRIVLLGLVIYVVSSTYAVEERIECGRQRLKAVHTMHNSTEAVVGQWPWHATIFHHKGDKLEHACGGTILDRNTILTAAHCVYSVSGVIPTHKMSIQLGRTELFDKYDYIRSHGVQEIVVHPKFIQNSVAHDIALIKLATNITMTKHVQPVCIWNLNDAEYSIIGKNGTIVGFSFIENDTIFDHLKKALIRIVDPLKCIESDRGAFGPAFTSDMICGNEQHGVRTCNGDNGGGMYFEINGKWFVRGLVAFTPGRDSNSLLCDGMKTKAFTDVSKYVGWIQEYIDPLVLHDKSEIIVDYDEKLKLFDFATCGKVESVDIYHGYLKKRSAYFRDESCFVMLISQWYAVGPARCFPNDGVELEVDIYGILLQIGKVITHPKFDSATYANDIALVELLHPISTNYTYIKFMCLPVTPEMRIRSFDNLYLQYYQRDAPQRDIPVTHLSNTDCRAKHTFARSILQMDQFCVEFELEYGEESYLHVDGFYLYQERQVGDEARMFLQGIEMHGNFTNSSGVAVFIDINPYVDWILYNMEFNEPQEDEEMLPFRNEPQMWGLKPNEDWFTPFVKSDCGQGESFNIDSIRNPIFPWIGWLHSNTNLTITEMSNDAIATLIHKRFALAAAAIMENKEQWRFVTFGAVGEYYSCQTEDCDNFIQELDQVNSTSCQRRFMLNRYFVEEQDISICTIYADGEEPAAIIAGAPLQDDISFDEYNGRRYFLRGLSYNLTERKRTVGERTIKSTHIPQLFTDINPFIDWIAEEVDRVYAERSRMIRNAPSKVEHLKSDEVYLSAIRNTEKRRLFDFETCGAPFREYWSANRNIPWLGLIHRTNEIGTVHKCGVILISYWYGISTASCAVNYTGNVAFTNGESVHHFPIQKVTVHPEYRAEDLNNNIAVIQLAKSANFVNPICLPIIDEIRTLGYKRSKLLTVYIETPFKFKAGYNSKFIINPLVDSYVDSIYCQTYWNESKPKFERPQSTPLQVNSTICVRYATYTAGMESEVEGSPMFSEHVLNGVKRLFLRGISLKSGTRKARYTFMYYLEIDDFLDWILDNVNDISHLN